MRPRAHGDVEILGVVVGFLSVDQGRGTGVHGDVVVLGVGTVGTGHHSLGLLWDKWEHIVSNRHHSETLQTPSFHYHQTPQSSVGPALTTQHRGNEQPFSSSAISLHRGPTSPAFKILQNPKFRERLASPKHALSRSQ